MTTRVLPRSGSVLDQQTPLLPGWDAADLNRAGRIPKILLVGRDLDCLRWMEGALVETGLGLVTHATEVASAAMALPCASFMDFRKPMPCGTGSRLIL